MANITQKGYKNIHGVNPQSLVEKVIRARIYDSIYWKEHCFALTAETLIDKAIAIQNIGGTYGNQKPTEFLCLVLKLLQLQPDKEILIEYLLAEEFKYLRAVAVFYVRLTFQSVEVYEILEPLLKDYRKLRYRDESGYSIVPFDEFVDQLLIEDRVCDIILPRLTKRSVLEETEGLLPRKSALGDKMFGEDEEDDEERGRASRSNGSDEEDEDRGRFVSRSPSRSAGSDGSRSRSRSRSGSRSRSRSRSGSVGSDGGESWRSRSRSISPDRLERMMREAVGEDRYAGAAGVSADMQTEEEDNDSKLDGDV